MTTTKKNPSKYMCWSPNLRDYLVANGEVVAKEKQVGDKTRWTFKKTNSLKALLVKWTANAPA